MPDKSRGGNRGPGRPPGSGEAQSHPLPTRQEGGPVSDVERLRVAWEKATHSGPGDLRCRKRERKKFEAIPFSVICDVLEVAGRAEIDLRTNINLVLEAAGLHPMMLMEKDLSVALARLHDQLEAQS